MSHDAKDNVLNYDYKPQKILTVQPAPAYNDKAIERHQRRMQLQGLQKFGERVKNSNLTKRQLDLAYKQSRFDTHLFYQDQKDYVRAMKTVVRKKKQKTQNEYVLP